MTGEAEPLGLTNCDREPIHIPGSIQPHGLMLVLDAANDRITHASANAGAMLNRTADLVGSTLADVLGDKAAHDLRNSAAKAGGGDVAGLLMELALPGLDHLVDASIHQHLGRTFVEIQPVASEGGSARDAFDITHSLVLRIGRETDLEAIARSGARLIRAMLGYDRVMVYRMLHNGAGLVIAEARSPSLGSFLGQHFPPSDIPFQARRLYLLNTIRGIADVAYEPVPILPPLGASEAPIDMSFAQLRSVSPIHCAYLQNMGVSASLSISVIVDGELWGLIACHHNTPKVVSMPLRIGAELFGRYFSLQIALAERRAQTVAAATAHTQLEAIIARLKPEEAVSASLRDSLAELAALLPCDGAGLWIEGEWHSIGKAPPFDEIEDVIALVTRTADGRVWQTDDLRAQLGNARVYGTDVAGVMAIPISSAPRDYLLLFRSEEGHLVEWAGEPRKTVTLTPEGERLTPRGSFEVWREEVRGLSEPWSGPERATAEMIRNYLRDVVLRFKDNTDDEHGRAEQRRRILNDELNHRVKNIIALVKSIAAQTGAHSGTVEDYASSLEGRLRALAFAHDQSLGGRAGDLAALIEAEAGLHRYGAVSERVVATGPKIGLDDRAFSVLALVVHEMMTNAAKYGSLSVPEGRLTLTWRREDNGDCVIEWLESCGPQVALPTREGFGSKLVRSTIGYDLGGSVVVDYRPTGVWACFVIPAARLLESVASIPVRAAAARENAFFHGKDVLVLEDQSLIAMDNEQTLRGLGAAEVRCCASITDAKAALAVLKPDCAILDFNLGDHTSAAIADDLTALGVPFIFATGYGDSVMIPERFRGVPVIRKPLSANLILDAFSAKKDD